MDKEITTAEAAKLLGFSKDHVLELVRSGTLPAIKVRNRWMISASAVASMMPNLQGQQAL